MCGILDASFARSLSVFTCTRAKNAKGVSWLSLSLVSLIWPSLLLLLCWPGQLHSPLWQKVRSGRLRADARILMVSWSANLNVDSVDTGTHPYVRLRVGLLHERIFCHSRVPHDRYRSHQAPCAKVLIAATHQDHQLLHLEPWFDIVNGTWMMEPDGTLT